mgnify:CR=1 FL=1
MLSIEEVFYLIVKSLLTNYTTKQTHIRQTPISQTIKCTPGASKQENG